MIDRVWRDALSAESHAVAALPFPSPAGKHCAGTSPASRDVVVIIPALNEEPSLPLVLADLPRMVDVIVIDNGSTDATANVARQGGATVLHEPIRGYGSACLRGLDYLEQSALVGISAPRVVAFLDADYSDHPELLPLLVKPILDGQADLVLGSQTLGRREARAMPPQAVFGNWLACFLMRLLFRTSYTDLGPFRAIDPLSDREARTAVIFLVPQPARGPPVTQVRNRTVGMLTALAITAAAIADCHPETGNTDAERQRLIDERYAEFKRSFPAVRDVSVDELVVLSERRPLVIVDVRPQQETDVSMIPGAVTRQWFEQHHDRCAGKLVATYCTIGARSGKYAEKLQRDGVDVVNLRDSILAWAHAGRPLMNKSGPTRRVHVYSADWDLLPAGYEAVW